MIFRKRIEKLEKEMAANERKTHEHSRELAVLKRRQDTIQQRLNELRAEMGLTALGG